MGRNLGTWALVGWSVLALVAGSPGCSESDDSAGSCAAESCRARCVALGYPMGGHCEGSNCTCGSSGDAGDGSGDIPGDVSGRTTRMTGKVWSPGGLVPISGALVYFAMTDPAPIPAGAYPEVCQDPPAFHGISAADGTVAIEVLPGTYRLVTQKGQFRRIRDITVPETGPAEINEDLTTLPSRTAEGDTIPHIALLWALEGGDHIEDVLAKMQMGTVGSDDRLVRGSEQFDIYNITGYPPNTELLENLDRMLQYHILFFPCTIWGGGLDEQLNDPTGPLSNPTVLANLRAYANSGGKIYATDMMYDIFEQPMPDYLDMFGDVARINDADETACADSLTASGWTSHGRSVDADLSAWLTPTSPTIPTSTFGSSPDRRLVRHPDPIPRVPFRPRSGSRATILDPGRTLPLTVTWPYGLEGALLHLPHGRRGRARRHLSAGVRADLPDHGDRRVSGSLLLRPASGRWGRAVERSGEASGRGGRGTEAPECAAVCRCSGDSGRRAVIVHP